MRHNYSAHCARRSNRTPRGNRSRSYKQTVARYPYSAMSFWMRSMASTVASASPKAVRRT